MSWHHDWSAMFRPEVLSKDPPRLGIDFITASAPETTVPLLDGELRLRQNLATYGIAGVVWNCARAVVAFLGDHPSVLGTGRVLELGAGTGAVGLALAASGCVEALMLTDLADVLPLTRENVEYASKQSEVVQRMIANDKIQTRFLCWGECIDESDPLLGDRSIVLCSDCLYDATNYSALQQTLMELTAHYEREGGKTQSPIVLISYKQRIPANELSFFENATEYFDISVYSPGDTDRDAELFGGDIYICKLERKDISMVPPRSCEASNNSE